MYLAVYVADGYRNARVHRFTPDGTLLQSWGEPGRGPGEFMCPHSPWIHSDGRVFVCDRENDRIQVFSAHGKLLMMWPDIPQPSDVCVGEEGHVYIGEEQIKAGRPRMSGGTLAFNLPSKVSVRDLAGNELTTWGNDDEFAPGNFMSAHSLCLDSQGDLYVAETPATDLSDQYKPGIKAVQKFVRI